MPVAVRLEQERRAPGGGGRRHRGPADARVERIAARVRAQIGQRDSMPGRRLRRHDVVPRRGQVRLQPGVSRRPAGRERAERRRLRAGTGAAVVRLLLVPRAHVAGEGVVVVHVVVLRGRADAERLRGGSGRLVHAADELAVRCRPDEERPVADCQPVHHQADEIDVRVGVQPCGTRLGREAEVHDVGADRARRGAGRRRRPLERREQVAVDARPVVPHDLADGELGTGRDPCVAAVVVRERRALAGPGGNACDVRPVAVSVDRAGQRVAAPFEEAPRIHDLARAQEARPTAEVEVVEVRVRDVGAGIEHGDADPGAGDPLVPERGRADVGRRPLRLVDLLLGLRSRSPRRERAARRPGAARRAWRRVATTRRRTRRACGSRSARARRHARARRDEPSSSAGRGRRSTRRSLDDGRPRGGRPVDPCARRGATRGPS